MLKKMQENAECSNENRERAMDHMHRYFAEKEQLVSECESVLYLLAVDENETESGGNEFENTLWRLRAEMVQLMQCDIQLWKQLTKLNASITTLKEDITSETLYRAGPVSFSSGSSDTESFVSAKEYSEVCSLDHAQTRVLSWIDQCGQGETATEDGDKGQPSISNWPKSRTCDDISSKSCERQNAGDLLLETCIIAKPLNRSRTYICTYFLNQLQEDLNSTSLDKSLRTIPRSLYEMKSVEETEILSGRNFIYYKSSLRLLGSTRMRSRIFEPSLTKWRPFAISNSSDKFIIVPPTAFSNIQPRPKLHRLPGVFENKTTRPDKESYDLVVGEDIKETESEVSIEIQSENVDEVVKFKTLLPGEDRQTLQSTSQIYDGSNTDITNETEDELKLTIYVQEITESDEAVWKTDISLFEEHGDPKQKVIGFKDQSDDIDDPENATRSLSHTEADLFFPYFLEVKDGFITCRIMSPELGQELSDSIIEQDDFEYLMIVDGRVTFTPHSKDENKEESFFLSWLFDNSEFEQYEDSYYIHLLFDETDNMESNTESGHAMESFCIDLLHEAVTRETNDACEDSFYINHLFEDSDTSTEAVYDELSSPYNFDKLFQELDIENEILVDEYDALCSYSQSSLDMDDDNRTVQGDSSSHTLCDAFALQETDYPVFEESDMSASWLLDNETDSEAEIYECSDVDGLCRYECTDKDSYME